MACERHGDMFVKQCSKCEYDLELQRRNIELNTLHSEVNRLTAELNTSRELNSILQCAAEGWRLRLALAETKK